MSRLTKYFALSVLTLSAAAAESLTVVNPSFGNVAVQCTLDFAYELYDPQGNCAGWEQQFNTALGIGWTFASNPQANGGDGLTGPNTDFEPPSFSGFPFTQAVFLQGSNAKVAQTISGFVPGGIYSMKFYLGSRFSSAYDGNQTVEAMIDGRVIGTWALTTFTPFTLQQTEAFTVPTGGSHILSFIGTVTGDHTAFFSDVSIDLAGSLVVQPSSGEPGIGLTATASGFAPFETVNLIAYASAPVPIGTASADATGAANVTGRIPQTPYGALGLQAVGQTSGAVASGAVALRPRLSTSPSTGVPGTVVAVSGFGFAAGETVSVIWSNPQTLLGGATANKNGSFSGQFAIPLAAQAGAAQVLARGQKTAALAGAQILVQ